MGHGTIKLNILGKIPHELIDIDVRETHALLGGPTLIHLKGKSGDALFLSTLLHANETTSFLVLQKLLKDYKEKEFPRDLIIFIGNTLAAGQGLRHLPGQADYNRIWEPGDTSEHKIANDVIEYAKNNNIFASIDIHNNTGKNPHYGCINVINNQFLDLASHFGSHTVFFTEPHNVQSMAFSKFCTSITVEAGLPGEPAGVEAAYKFVKTIFEMDKLTANSNRESPEVFHTIARMKVNPEASIDFEDDPESASDLSFIPDIDSRNFEVVPKSTHIGYTKNLSLIKVEDNNGRDITSHFFKEIDGELLTKQVFIPSMFTKDVYVMKEDCLGYIMEVMIPLL